MADKIPIAEDSGESLALFRTKRFYEGKLDDPSITLDTILEQAPIGIAIAKSSSPYGTDRRFINVNSAFERITGRTREEIIELGWAKITHPEDLDKDLENFQKLLAGEIGGYTMEKRYIKPDGAVVWVHMVVAPLRTADWTDHNHICLVRDITEQKALEKTILESERSKSVLLASLPGMAYRCDYVREWTMRFVSQGCYDLTGYPPESLIGNRDLSFNDLIAPEYRETLWREWEQSLARGLSFKYEYEIITALGQRKWVLEMGQGVSGEAGGVEALEGIIIDITDRREYELKLKHISEIDGLTGLYNRRYLESLLEEARADKKEIKRAVIILSLRNINSIRLAYGYNASESLIKDLSASFLSLAESRRRLFHISFDRFAFFCTGYAEKQELTAFCQAILNEAGKNQLMSLVGCSAGIYEFGRDARDADTIISSASSAAEDAGRNMPFGYRFFDSDLDSAAKRDADIKTALIQIVGGHSESRIYLQYQPIFCLKTGKIRGFEALARFKSEQLGVVPPDAFIPAAEETQLIVPIGKRIIHMACAFKEKLDALGFGETEVSVNVSAIQLLRENFADELLDILAQYRIAPNGIGLEITESVFAGNCSVLNERLSKLRRIGMRIAIDDFGTGYSSLARERDLHIDVLKIDKSFVDKLLTQKPEEAITGDIISMAHKLGQRVVAEGVECVSQKEYLAGHHCDMLQGYLISRPLDEADAIEFLKASIKGA